MPLVFDTNKDFKKKDFDAAKYRGREKVPAPSVGDERRRTGRRAEDWAFPQTEEAEGIEKILPGFLADRTVAVRPLESETQERNLAREEDAVGRDLIAKAQGTAQGIASATAAGAKEPGLTAEDAVAAHRAGVNPIESAIRQEVERVLAARDRTGQQGAQGAPGTGEAPAARAVLADGTVVERRRQDRRTPPAAGAVEPEAAADAESKKTDLREKYFQRRAGLSIKDAKGFLMLGRWAYENNLPNEAKVAIDTALRIDPTQADAKELLGKIDASTADAEKAAHFDAQDKAAAANRRAIIKEMDAKIAAAGDGSAAWDKKRAIRLEYEKRLRGEAPTAVAQTAQQANDFLGNIMGPDISPESGLAKAVASDPVIAKYEKTAASLLKFARKRGVTPGVAVQTERLRTKVAKRIATVSAAHKKAEKVKADAVNLKVQKAKTQEAKDAANEERDQLAAIYVADATAALNADNPNEAKSLVADALKFYPESSSTNELMSINAKAKSLKDTTTAKSVAENRARITAEKAVAAAAKATEKAAVTSEVTKLEPDVDLAKEDYTRALVEHNRVLGAIEAIESKPPDKRKDFDEQLAELKRKEPELKGEADRLKAIRDEKVQHIANIKAGGTAFFQEKTAASVPTEPKGPQPPKPKKAGDKLPEDIARQYRSFYGGKQAARSAAKQDGWGL